MTTICTDIGNTLIKVAVVAEGKAATVTAFPLDNMEKATQHIESLPPVNACIVSSVSVAEPTLMKALSGRAPYVLELTGETPVPINNLYATPETLGKDRLAAVVGAHELFPGRNVLVIDAGTALTFDFIDSEGNYRGGNISLGLQIRYRALHDYTKRLPLEHQSDDFKPIGDSTSSAIIAGVQTGMIFEIEGYIDRFTGKYPDLMTIITGGDMFFFENKIKKHIFAHSDLIFIGLNEIVTYNLKN